MKRTISAITAAAIAATMAVATPAPASAQSLTFGFSQGDRVISRYCDRNWRDRDCRDWRDNHRRWDRDNYRRFYRGHSSGLDNLASGLFGFTFGAIIGGALANRYNDRYYDVPVYSSHVARCEARYRSYDPRTDTFLGYDGYRHRCRL